MFIFCDVVYLICYHVIILGSLQFIQSIVREMELMKNDLFIVCEVEKKLQSTQAFVCFLEQTGFTEYPGYLKLFNLIKQSS